MEVMFMVHIIGGVQSMVRFARYSPVVSIGFADEATVRQYLPKGLSHTPVFLQHSSPVSWKN